MLVVKSISEKKRFICGSSEKTADVQFSDKSFRGVLCLTHIYEKLKQIPEQPQNMKKSTTVDAE